jgi:hypothetical protein
MANAADTDTEPDGIGLRLDALFARLAMQGIDIGIRERVIAGRVVAQLAIDCPSNLSAERWAFLLQAWLTPVLAKSPEQSGRIRRAFLDVFPQTVEEPDRAAPVRPALADSGARNHRTLYAAAAALLAVALAAGLAVMIASTPPPTVTGTGNSPSSSAPAQTFQPSGSNADGPGNASPGTDQLAPIVTEILDAAAGRPEVSISALAKHMARVTPGSDARRLISLLQRYEARAAHEPFALTESTLANLACALASQRYPGWSPSRDVMVAAVAAARQKSGAATGSVEGPPALPPPVEMVTAPLWLTATILALPLTTAVWWLLGRYRRLKDYLRRRTPERPPLVHELVVNSSADISRERTALTRAAMRLGRSRHRLSRTIDVAATVEATARGGGFPHVVFTPALTTPEYLVLISTKGPDDHSMHRFERFVDDLAAQNLTLVRYFMAHDANLFYDAPDGPYFRLDQLAARYPDHRVIFLGTGEQFLNPGTLAAWSWAEELTAWPRRAILTPKPIREWGAPEVALARLFDAPPGRADADGLLKLAELFELRAPPGPESLAVRRNPLRWSWTSRPRRWLVPLPPDDSAFELLESELARYFVDERGDFDERGFWWFAACAIYPALRWDLTVYLGLKLTVSRSKGALPLYSEARALQLANLPWFRDGFMPGWLRRRLIASLPRDVRLQTAALLRDLLERAVKPGGEIYDVLRLRIAQDQPDPAAARPERDEIFLDALATADPLALEAPRNLRQLVSGMRNPFVAREWTILALLAAYWCAAALLVPWPSDGALATGSWLPLVLLLLAVVTLPAAQRLSQWARDRADRFPAAPQAED